MAQLSYPLDDTLYTAADAQVWHSTRTQGVYSSNSDLILTPTTAMTINLSPGIAWLKYNRFTNAVYANTTDLQFTLDTADGILARLDRLVVRWDNVTNTITAQIKKGTAAVNPIAPVLQRDAEVYEIGLFDIRVRPGALQITAADLIDLRLNETLCGIMRDGVTGIPTQNLYDAWWAWFNALKTSAEGKVENSLNDWLAYIASVKGLTDAQYKELSDLLEALTSSSNDSFNSFISQLQQQMTDFDGTWQDWMALKEEELNQYPAGEWMAKVENLIAEQPTELITTVPNKNYNYPQVALWDIENGIKNTLEQWGFSDGILTTVPFRAKVSVDNGLQLFSIPIYKADDWQVTHYRDDFWLLSSLAIDKALLVEMKG